MPEFAPTIESVEEYLHHLKRSADLGAANVATLEELNEKEYAKAVAKIEYWRFVQTGDYHYFISRVLYLLHIAEYSYFSGHQCIENYFKAYLVWRNHTPPKSHKLSMLLGRCRSSAPGTDTFIHEESASIISAKYEPFYELARYPVQRRRPKGGYVFFIPDDVYVLDYFVLRMRRILPIPGNTWDILKDGHFSLYQCQQWFPAFYGLFFENNINFQAQK